TLVAVNKQGKITLWDLSGPEPQWKLPRFSGKTLEELEPPERELLGDRVRRHPAGAPLPDEWRAALPPPTRPLPAPRPAAGRGGGVTESGVAVTREGRDGKETTILQWSPPGEVLRTQFSGDGRHLVVTYWNDTVEVIRLEP